jgi:hypothetical protein
MQEQNNSQGARGVPFGIAAMAVVVTASNILVQYPINNWLTWGALSYPFAFLVTDLTNRRLGPGSARRVVWVGLRLRWCCPRGWRRRASPGLGERLFWSASLPTCGCSTACGI